MLKDDERRRIALQEADQRKLVGETRARCAVLFERFTDLFEQHVAESEKGNSHVYSITIAARPRPADIPRRSGLRRRLSFCSALVIQNT